MSVTSSIPRIKILNSPSSSSPSTSTRTANSCCSSSLKFSPTKATKLTILCSQTEGPIRRPMAPPSPREKPSSTQPPSTPPPSPPPSNKAAVASGESVISLEFQRQKARELQEYFKQKKLEEANQGPAFGFVAKNEISNGRWAMFGFAVGMLTEYATGSDFVDQVKILLSNFGILDLE